MNLATRVAQDLKESGLLKDYRIGVKYKDGVAHLLGSVTSERQKKLAERIKFAYSAPLGDTRSWATNSTVPSNRSGRPRRIGASEP